METEKVGGTCSVFSTFSTLSVTERTAYLENENINLRNRINEVRYEKMEIFVIATLARVNNSPISHRFNVNVSA